MTFAPAADEGVALPSQPGAGPRKTEDILEAFLEAISRDDLAAEAPLWGEKMGHSMFDEEEVLGRWMDMQLDNYLDDLADELSDVESGDDEEGEEYGLQDGLDLWTGVDAYAFDSTVDLPRAARILKPLCGVYHVGPASPEVLCPICFDDLSPGQTAWTLPCTHAFHEVCIARWLSVRFTQGACPVCRCDIKLAAAESLVSCTA